MSVSESSVFECGVGVSTSTVFEYVQRIQILYCTGGCDDVCTVCMYVCMWSFMYVMYVVCMSVLNSD